jgi:hypothetical protein
VGLGISNVRSLYRPASITTMARELVRHALDLMGVQGVRCDERGFYERKFIFSSIRKENKIINYSQDSSYARE